MSWSLHLGDESPVDGHTYNLSAMWRLSGVVEGSTRDLDGLTGAQIAARCKPAVARAIEYPEAFRALDPENGWGDYDGFVEVLVRLWRCAAAHPRDKAEWSG